MKIDWDELLIHIAMFSIVFVIINLTFSGNLVWVAYILNGFVGYFVYKKGKELYVKYDSNGDDNKLWVKKNEG